MATRDTGGYYVYPLIPKKYVKPVLFACQIIRQKKTFNKAIKLASDYYGVNPEIVKKHVIARTQAGCTYSRKSRFAHQES